MVLSAHLCQVLQPWRWYGSRFSGPVCLNRPYIVGSLLDQIGSAFQLGVFGISFPKRFNAVLSYLWKRTSRVTRVTLVLWIGNETLRSLPSSSRCRQGSFRQRNLRSGWRVRQYDLTTSLRQRRRHCVRDGVAPSANELAWFYMGSDSVTQWAFSKRFNAVSRSLFREQGLRE